MHPQARPDRAPLCPVLIGRDDLLALLARRMSTARSGTGHLLFLAGEAGIGKTRLLTEACKRAEPDAAVISVNAYPRDSEAAGGILADLGAELQHGSGRDAAGVGARIMARLHDGGGNSGDAYRQRRLLITDLTELIMSISADGPVLLALEDLHWTDDLTFEVLERTARHLSSVPMLVVATFRTDELYPSASARTWRARMLNQRLAEEARLSRLDRAETAAMATTIAGDSVPSAVAVAVHERSDGIPLHVEEFLAFLASPDASGLAVPDTLADAVIVRADALSAPARRLAGAASVIGRSFDIDLLAAVVDDDPERVDESLRELRDRFFVLPRGDRSAYEFRHALIRDALYDDLPPLRRRDLHAAVAGAAAAAGLGDGFVSDHFERANQPAPAHRYALAAAADATTGSAHRAAVELYRRAERTAPAGLPESERAAILAALAAELAAVDDNAEAAAAYGEAGAVYRRLGDLVSAAALAPAYVAVRHLLGADLNERSNLLLEALAAIDLAPDRMARVRILAALAAAYMLDRRLTEAIDYGHRAKALASGLGDQAVRLNTDASLGSSLVFAGQMDDGWQLLESAIAEAIGADLETEAARGYRMIGSSASVLVEYDRAQRWLGEGINYTERTERFNDRHYMAAHLAHTQWATGQWHAADTTAVQALADGRGGVTTRITALHVLGYLALGRGDWLAADRNLREALRLGDQMRELQRVSPALWGLAETALHSGRGRDAVAWCERGYAASAEVRDAAYLFPYVVTGTRAYLALDDPSGARDWVDRTGQLLQERAIPGTLPALDHARGLLHLAGGRTAQARETLAVASTRWDDRNRFWEGTQALIDRADAAARSRRAAEASALAIAAHERAEAAGATILALKAASIRGDAGAEVLTPREIEVARLIATGATNRQVAEALFISPKTVAAHVEHILTKLGAARRSEIAAWAAQRAGSTGGRST